MFIAGATIQLTGGTRMRSYTRSSPRIAAAVITGRLKVGSSNRPGLTDMSKSNFAKPVIASGAVDTTTFTVTDKPNVKFEEGTSVFGGLNSDTVDHPSAQHCPKNALP
jgi:hypothetical protein